MTQDELIKLRNTLLNHYKNELYCSYNTHKGTISSNGIPTNEIKSKVDTAAAQTKFEEEVENYMKDILLRSINFDTIEITLYNNLFVSKFFQNKIENSTSIHESIAIKKEITQEDILPEITSTEIQFRALKDDKLSHISHATINLGYIKYDEFVTMIESLGYTITPKTFEELAKIIAEYPHKTMSTIKIVFSQEQKFTR